MATFAVLRTIVNFAFVFLHVFSITAVYGLDLSNSPKPLTTMEYNTEVLPIWAENGKYYIVPIPMMDFSTIKTVDDTDPATGNYKGYLKFDLAFTNSNFKNLALNRIREVTGKCATLNDIELAPFKINMVVIVPAIHLKKIIPVAMDGVSGFDRVLHLECSVKGFCDIVKTVLKSYDITFEYNLQGKQIKKLINEVSKKVNVVSCEISSLKYKIYKLSERLDAITEYKKMMSLNALLTFDNCKSYDTSGNKAVCRPKLIQANLYGASSTNKRGRLLVRVNSNNIQSLWGTVCNFGFNTNDAKVVCRQLYGQNKGKFYTVPGGSGPIWLAYLACNGTETNLGQCKHDGWGSGSLRCKHNFDVGIDCN